MDNSLASVAKRFGVYSITTLSIVILPWIIHGAVAEHRPRANRRLPDTQRATYTQDDLLVAFPTHSKNSALINASRPWRRGVRTYILVDSALDVTRLRQLGAFAPGRRGRSLSPVPFSCCKHLHSAYSSQFVMC